MTDAEWAAVRPLLPVPAWIEGRGAQPEGYCHRDDADPPTKMGNALPWVAKSSLPLVELKKPTVVRSVLNALTLKPDGTTLDQDRQGT